ncbi:MAG: nucleoside deaminase [Candidatus Melainabacteria bacterium]|nr:nucleoside deaminase [Candidatus Melainabacteria bacterium]
MDILKTDQEWMLLALKAAEETQNIRKSQKTNENQKTSDNSDKTAKDIPVGAVIVENGTLICTGQNRKELLNDATAHAEIIALRQAAEIKGTWRLPGTVLYTTLEPCPMCAEAIIQSRVSKVVFGAYDPLSGALGSAFNLYTGKRPYPIPEVLGGILESECSELLKQFFAKGRPN